MESKQILKRDEDYKQGWIDCMTFYATWKNGEQCVGIFETPLEYIKKTCVDCYGFKPPSK